jgi:hypothetical protein
MNAKIWNRKLRQVEAEHCLNMLVKEFFKPIYNKQRGKLKMLYANQIKKLFENIN